jgi:RHS repeat-associated protein
VDAVGNRTAYAYDDEGRLLSVTAPRGRATTHTAHDSFGNAGEITDPLGNVTSRTYDGRGRLRRQADTLGHETQETWDGLDRLVRTARTAGTGSDDEVVETEYYPGGEVRLVRNPNGAETAYTIDGLSRVVATSTTFDGQMLTTAATWDANGNKETETDRRGVTRRNTYDELNRLVAVEVASGLPDEGPTGRIASYTYDLVGNRLSETNLAGLTTRFELDGLYRVIARLLPEANPTTAQPYREAFLYDRVGNLLSQTDANGHARTFEYDGLNRRTRTTNALGQAVTTTYLDPEGSRVNRSEDHDLTCGLRTTFSYDALNRETQRVVRLEGEGGGGEAYSTTTAYDDAGHAVSVTDPRGNVTRTRLDGLDRPFEMTVDPGGLDLLTRTSYDGLGNRKSVTDANGHTTTFRHDGLGRLVLTTDAAGATTAAEYDGEGLKTRETDRRSVVRVLTYDNVGRPRTEALASAPLSGVPWRRETRYLDSARRRIEVDARGHETTFELDGLDRVAKETDALGAYRTFRWDGVDKREETDKRPDHHATLFEYDALDRLVQTTDPAPFQSQTVELTYDDAGNRVLEKDRRGFVKRTQLDPLGRVVHVTRALGVPADETAVETNTYDGNGNRVTQTDAEGRQVRFSYDAANRLLARTDGFGTPDAATTDYRLDGVGNVVEERDGRAALIGQPWSVRRTFDALDRLETETNGEGGTTTYGYDAEGHRTSVTAPAGRVTRFEYDERGALTRVVQPAASPGDPEPATAYAYDENRNRLRQTDANGHAVAMEYDALDRLTRRIQDPADASNPSGLGLATSTQYDEDGRPVLETDPKGQSSTLAYDELGRLRSRTMALAAGAEALWRRTSAIGYEYDANGNLTRATETTVDAAGVAADLATERTWDGLDRLTSETATLPDGGTRTTTYAYWRNGLRKSLTDPSGLVTAYEYDGRNRLARATTGFGTGQAATTAYEYWPDDLLRTVTYPNGVTAGHEYDRADRTLSITNTRGATVVSSYQYFGTDTSGQPVSYDPNGNRLVQVETNGGVTETTRYAYDGLDRLASVSYPTDASFPTGRVVTYAYDAVGNRIRETERDGAGTVLADRQGVFDNLNRLQSLTDTARPAEDPERLTTFEWDANGNQTAKTVGSVGSGESAVTTRYAYDTRDKLVEARQASGSGGSSILGRFQYDFEGRRTKKIGEEGLRQYVFDQTSLLAEYDSAGLQKAKYDYGSDRLIALTRSDEGRRYFSLDGLRSVVNLTDDSGSPVASYHLDPWGNFRFPSELDSSRNRFAFTGHVYDDETGLYNAKARYFDPKLGRFLTQDSFLGQIDEPPSLHRYLYALDNPVRFVDPTGHAAGDLWDPRTYFGSKEARAGAWSGAKEGYFENAADVGDSLAGFGKGAGKAAWGLGTGLVGLAAKGVELDLKLKSGNPSKMLEAASEAYSIGKAAVGQVKESFALLGHGIANPGDVLDAMGQIGIDKSAEAVGGATFETGLLLAPAAKGAPTAAVAAEGRRATAAAVSAAAPPSGAAVAAGSELSLASRVAREVLRPVMREVGGLPRVLRPGRQLTAGDKLRRFLLQDTKGYPGVSYSPVGRFLKEKFPGLELQQHHAFLQRKWIRPGGPHQWYATDVLAQRGLQRLTDAGWNLMPIPGALNRALGRSAAGTAAFAGGIASAIGLGVYAAIPGEPASPPHPPAGEDQ